MSKSSTPFAGDITRVACCLLLAGLCGAVAGCGKPETIPTPVNAEKKTEAQTDHKSEKPKGAETPADNSDQARLQGVWAVEEYDAGNPITAPPPAVLKTMRYTFTGDKLRHSGEYNKTKYEENYSFTLDTKSNPKGMNITRLGDDGKPTHGTDSDTMPWIYKLDGDHLVIAETSGKRPSEFLPKPPTGRRPGSGGEAGKKEPYVPGVDVIRLKRVNEPASPPKQ